MPGDPYYRSAEWRLLRKAALLRDGGHCATPGCEAKASHVDHIVPRKAGGADALPNLRSLCASCHSRVTRFGNAAPLRAVGCDADGWPVAVMPGQGGPAG